MAFRPLVPPAALRALLPMAALLLALAPADARDWPSARGDARNTGYTPYELAPPLKLAWRSPARVSYSLLLASGGAICVGTKRPETFLYSTSGRLLWKLDRAVPAYLKNELLVVVSTRLPRAPRVECYNWRTRTLRWSHPLTDNLQQFWGAIAHEGRLYCAYNLWSSNEGLEKTPIYAGMTVLTLEEGTPLAEWIGVEGGWGQGPPACDGQSVYWGMGHWLHALDARTLEPQWAHHDGGNTYPVSAGNLIITQGWSHRTQALDKDERKPVWGISAWRGAAHCLARGADGMPLLIQSIPSPQALAAVDVLTGQMVWRYPIWVGGRMGEGLAVGSGRFVFAPGWHENLPGQKQLKGGFYGFDAATGRLRWKYERPFLKGATVIVSEGSLYALGSDGFLYKFVRAQSALSPLPVVAKAPSPSPVTRAAKPASSGARAAVTTKSSSRPNRTPLSK